MTEAKRERDEAADPDPWRDRIADDLLWAEAVSRAAGVVYLDGAADQLCGGVHPTRAGRARRLLFFAVCIAGLLPDADGNPGVPDPVGPVLRSNAVGPRPRMAVVRVVADGVFIYRL